MEPYSRNLPNTGSILSRRAKKNGTQKAQNKTYLLPSIVSENQAVMKTFETGFIRLRKQGTKQTGPIKHSKDLSPVFSFHENTFGISRNIDGKNQHNVSIPMNSIGPAKHSLLLQRRNSSLEQTQFQQKIEGTQCLNQLSLIEELQMKGQYIAHREYQLDLLRSQIQRNEQQQQVHLETKLSQSRLERETRIGSSQLKSPVHEALEQEASQFLGNCQDYSMDGGELLLQQFKLLKTKEMQFDEKAEPMRKFQKGGFPPRELPINQRINQLMYLSKEQFMERLQGVLGQTLVDGEREKNNPYLVTVTKDFFKQPLTMQQELAAHPTNFNYDHKQLIPRSTFFSTKKEKKSEYQISINQQKSRQQEECLKINSFQMKHRYRIYDTSSPPPHSEAVHQLIPQPVQEESQQLLEENESLKASVRASVMQLEDILADTQKRVVLLQKSSIKSDSHKSKIGSIVSNKLYINVKPEEDFHLNSSINTQQDIKSDNNRSKTELRNHYQETFAAQSMRQSIEQERHKTLETDLLPLKNSSNLAISDENQQARVDKQSWQKRSIVSMISVNQSNAIQADETKRFQSVKEITLTQPQKGEVDNPILFFQTELSGGVKEQSSQHQTHSPLRNSVVSKALIQDFNKSFNESINLTKMNVKLSDVKITPKIKQVDYPIIDKERSIFQAGDTKNCKEFLNTYFESKEPRSFDNFKKKFQMQNARKEMAKKEREKLASLPLSSKKLNFSITPPRQQLL